MLESAGPGKSLVEAQFLPAIAKNDHRLLSSVSYLLTNFFSCDGSPFSPMDVFFIKPFGKKLLEILADGVS